MRIGIDARLYTQTGVGRYLRNLISELSILDKENEYFIYLRKKEYSSFELPGRRWHKRLMDISWHSLTEQIKVPFILLKDNLHVCHFPYFNVPVFYPKKYLITIHDLIVDHFDTGRASTLSPLLYKIKRLGYKLTTFAGTRRTSFILTISQTTNNEVMEHFRVSENKIDVTYDALDKNFESTVKKKKPEKYFDFPYILYVGNAYPHKNLERLIRALKIIYKEKKVKLVLAGDDNYFFPRLKSYARKQNLIENIVFFGEADDNKLVDLYTNASCLVFPSLMEGFGLPNFEALACGLLPVVSDIPVFREIWGERLSYFNPYKIEDIAQKILQTLNLSKDEYKKKVDKAKERIKDFSWRKTAEKTLKLYEKIYSDTLFSKF